MDNRPTEIIVEARAIFTSIEEESTPISRIALRARRLAQLVEDDEAFVWLRLECEGLRAISPTSVRITTPEAPEKGVQKFFALRATPDFSKLPMAQLSAALAHGEIIKRDQVIGEALANLEAYDISATEAEIRSALPGDATAAEALSILRMRQMEVKSALGRVKAAIHEWASTIYVTSRIFVLGGESIGP